MRLALKLILATVIGIVAVFMSFGIVRARREVALFDSDMRKDHTLIGSTLGLCVANTWRTSGPNRALELVSQADAARPDLRIGWIHPDGTESSRAPVLSPSTVPTTQKVDHQVRHPSSDPTQEFLVTRIPVRSNSSLLGV